jgi:hypothetical protein
MKTYSVGTKVFCDFHFGGKPKGVCIEVLEEGLGNRAATGKIRVKLSETVGAYNKGEIVELPAWTAVPVKQEKRLTRGQIFRRVDTNYQWIKG